MAALTRAAIIKKPMIPVHPVANRNAQTPHFTRLALVAVPKYCWPHAIVHAVDLCESADWQARWQVTPSSKETITAELQDVPVLCRLNYERVQRLQTHSRLRNRSILTPTKGRQTCTQL
jgi:hypothetical protein